jgi:hypothetical protein
MRSAFEAPVNLLALPPVRIIASTPPVPALTPIPTHAEYRSSDVGSVTSVGQHARADADYAEQMTWVSVLGVIALIAVVVAFGTLIYLHIAPTGLSPVVNAISQYGITRFSLGYRIVTIALGISGLAIAVGVSFGLPTQSTGLWVISLSVFGVARLIISWFVLDAPGDSRTMSGRNHDIISLITFVAMTTAAFLAEGPLAAEASWSSLAPVSVALGSAMGVFTLAALVFALVPRLRRVFGIAERLLYAAVIAWLAVFAIACITHAR